MLVPKQCLSTNLTFIYSCSHLFIYLVGSLSDWDFSVLIVAAANRAEFCISLLFLLCLMIVFSFDVSMISLLSTQLWHRFGLQVLLGWARIFWSLLTTVCLLRLLISALCSVLRYFCGPFVASWLGISNTVGQWHCNYAGCVGHACVHLLVGQ